MHFVPESAKRPESYRTTRSTDATLVIDYGLLATMPVAPEIRRGELTQRDTDMDELKKELKEIKKKLAEQEEERIRSSPSTPKKPAPRSIP